MGSTLTASVWVCISMAIATPFPGLMFIGVVASLDAIIASFEFVKFLLAPDLPGGSSMCGGSFNFLKSGLVVTFVAGSDFLLWA